MLKEQIFLTSTGFTYVDRLIALSVQLLLCQFK